MQAWKEDYPWLQLAFKHIGPAGKAASEGWRARIEDDLQTTLDFKLRGDGTATVWCGLSGYDFRHDPTPKELLEGLADAYRREVKRVGAEYPTRTGMWRMSNPASTAAAESSEASGPVSLRTRDGEVEISREACDELLDELRSRGHGEVVAHALGSSASLVELDRGAKIALFDALWALAERAGGDELIDPQLRLLRDRLRSEIAEGLKGT